MTEGIDQLWRSTAALVQYLMLYALLVAAVVAAVTVPAAVALPQPARADATTVTASCPPPHVDCTASLLSAMNTTGATLIIVPRLPDGKSWPVRPMIIANAAACNRTIVLQAGVEIVAMTDPVFHWPLGICANPRV